LTCKTLDPLKKKKRAPFATRGGKRGLSKGRPWPGTLGAFFDEERKKTVAPRKRAIALKMTCFVEKGKKRSFWPGWPGPSLVIAEAGQKTERRQPSSSHSSRKERFGQSRTAGNSTLYDEGLAALRKASCKLISEKRPRRGDEGKGAGTVAP